MIKTLQYVQTPWGYFELDIHSDLEQAIVEDVEWQEGLFFGKPRYGHPEGKIIAHIYEVLANVDNLRWKIAETDYQKLRLITLIHDTFKHKVDESKPRVGANHHAFIARQFAEKYISDKATLDIIELHDEAYHAWRQEYFCNNPDEAQKRLEKLLARLGENLQLFYLFFVCDTQTGDKIQDSLRWFEQKTGIQRVDARIF
ncbi:MAG: HD domain-containing protein [Raineya sp.]|nr:HD domain-containing protein [Raineya sp.]